MKRILNIFTILLVCVVGLSTAGCQPEKQKTTFTETIRYSLVPRDEAVALYANEAFHAQVTQLFMDITQQQKGVNHDEWIEMGKKSIKSPSKEIQAFLDSIAAVQTATLKSLNITLPIKPENRCIDMDMKVFGGMTAFTSATRVYANFDHVIEVENMHPGIAAMIMWHEMWHVISRNNPTLRQQMYALIGFHVLPAEIDIPAEVKAHILCNPDVERHDSYATFTIHGQPTDCMLMLYTTASEYIEGTSLGDYVKGTDGYWLLALDRTTHKPYRGKDGQWVVYNCTEASDFEEVMSGGNSSYCDDPEECMADNFAYAMLSNTDVPNQQLLRDVLTTLRNYAQTAN